MSTDPAIPENDANLSGLGRALLESKEGSKPSGPWVPPTAEELGKLLPEYEIVKMLGRGGMGAVYMGRQKSLDRPVAIKILSNTLDEADASFAERFKNEARAMGKLNHPGIVAVHDFGQTSGGLLYIVMEYVEGTDVARMIAKEGRLHTDHAMAITAHVCDALAYAHERGIIHRDIKPANIMVGYDGVVKVADFGLAKMTHSNASGLTQSGMAMGTLHYMAPEALMLGSAVDHRADIYAVGVMLYQMLTGKIPQGMFKLPSLQIPGLDPRYDAIIAKGIMEDREARYQSVSEMRRDLDGILTQPVVKVEAEVSQAPAALPTQARPQRPGGMPYRAPQSVAHQKPVAKSSSAWLVWAVLGVLALGGGYVLLNRSSQGGQTLGETPKDRSLANNATPTAPVTVAVTPPQPAPMIVPTSPVESVSKTDMKTATATERRPFRWELTFTKETYESRSSLPQPRPTPEDVNLIQSDHNHGVLRWQFADKRLSQPGLKITGALMRFHTADTQAAGTESRLFVTFDEKTIGSQSGALVNTWNEISLNTDKIPRNSMPFDLVLQCGQNGVVVCNQKSKFPARLILIGEETNAVTVTDSPVFDLQQLPDFRTRVANYQKARHAQLGDLTTKFRNALTTTKTAAPADAAAYDAALAQITTRTTEIEKNLTATEVNPLATLPALAVAAPARLKELWSIFGSETAKIETALVASLDQSLATVQASLTQAANLEAAKAVESYRKQVLALFAAPSPAVALDLMSLADWSKVGGAIWEVVGGAFQSSAFLDGYLTRVLPYDEYELTGEFMASATANGGVFFSLARAPVTGQSNSGYQLQLAGTASLGKSKTGSIGGNLVRDNRFADDTWIAFRIRLANGKIQAWLNGVTYADFSQPPESEKPRGRMIALHQKGVGTVSYRNLRVTPVTPAATTVVPPPASSANRTLLQATKDKPFVNSLGMKFVPVRITGGPTDGKTLLFSVWETRVRDYAAFAAANTDVETSWKDLNEAGVTQTPDHPVVNVTWNDAVRFCEWLTKKDGIICRLPSDHEWSCAAGIGDSENPALTPIQKNSTRKSRRTDGPEYPWGTDDKPPSGFANYKGTQTDAFPFTAPVGSFPATADGLHDLWGNATEWCADWHDPASKMQHVLRGHSWENWGPVRTVNWRLTMPREANGTMVGFRCVIELPVATTSATPPAVVSPTITTNQAPPVSRTPASTATTSLASATKDKPFVNSLGMKFVPVRITSGPTDGKTILFSVWETRVQDYAVYESDTGRKAISPAFQQKPDHPKVMVSWEDANQFCEWLTRRERQNGSLSASERFRLPKDHEWSCAVGIGDRENAAMLPSEKAGRLGLTFPWGTEWPPAKVVGNFAGEEFRPAYEAGKYSGHARGIIGGWRDGFVETSPVGSFPANDAGLYDLSGNVWEWCEDWHDSLKKDRVYRGGSWTNFASGGLSSAARGYRPPTSLLDIVGFRVVLELP